MVDSQQAISRDSNANSGGGSNANSGGQSATNASVPAALEVRDPPTRRTTRRAGMYDIDTSNSIHHFRERLRTENERHLEETRHHYRNMNQKQSVINGLVKDLSDRDKALRESAAAIVEKDRLIAQLREATTTQESE